MTEQQHGLDVSHHQGRIDWSKVAKSGRTFAYCKTTEGLTYVDDRWQANLAGATAAGLVVGGYHFAHPGQSPTAQADFFGKHHGRWRPGMLPPVLDLERHDGLNVIDLPTWCTAFLGRLRSVVGTPLLPLIYMSPAFCHEHLGSTAQHLKAWPLWHAQYAREAHVPDAWSRYTIWQYSSTGRVPGIRGNVDLDVFDGTLQDLRRFARLEQPRAPKPARKVPPPCTCP